MARKKAADEEAAAVPPTVSERLRDFLARVEFVTYTLLVLFLMSVAYFSPRMFIVVPAGHRGVMFRYLHGGTVHDRTWPEGLHIIPPWDKLSLYDTRLQQNTLKLQMLSEEGLSLGATVAVSYKLNQEMLSRLQQDVGMQFFDRLIKPQVEAHIRRVFGTHRTYDVYTSIGEVLQELSRIPKIGADVQKAGSAPVFNSYLDVLELKLMATELPKVVEKAIAEKFHQEQLMLEYRYKLEREVKESERKRAEATGVRDYMAVTGLHSMDFLRWRSIEAALELSKSTNSKILMLGGQGQMPVMLNLGDGNQTAAASPGVASPVSETEPPEPAIPPSAKPAPAVTKGATPRAAEKPPAGAATKGTKTATSAASSAGALASIAEIAPAPVTGPIPAPVTGPLPDPAFGPTPVRTLVAAPRQTLVPAANSR